MSPEARQNERDAENVPRLGTGVAAANGDGSTPIKQSREVRKGNDVKNKVLVAGASGLVGVAAIESFLAAGWDVIGISRRKPELPSGRDFRFISVDLRDEKAARQKLSPLADVTHVAYAAIYENADDLVSGWSNEEQIKVNNAMLRNVIEPLVSEKSALKHVSILQGTKAYGVYFHPIAIPARESDPRDKHANFFFDQQDYVRDAGAKHGFTYTVLRPQLVTGKAPGAPERPPGHRRVCCYPPREG